jgi:hypothetical protein
MRILASQLPGRTPSGAPPHPQGAQEKGAEEHNNADDEQVQQALGYDAHDPQHYRHDHQQEE